MKKYLLLAVVIINILVSFVGCAIAYDSNISQEIDEKHNMSEVENNTDENLDYIEPFYFETEYADIEKQRIAERFPHVSSQQEFISLDNGTLVDIRLFEAWEFERPNERTYKIEDLEFIFDLFIRHIDHINSGDIALLFGEESTMMGMDASDANYFHPRIEAFMEIHKETELFVHRIELTSVGFGFRIVASNDKMRRFTFGL